MSTETIITDAALQNRLQQSIDNKTKPLGALGKLEKIALQTGFIQRSTSPVIRNPHIVVFAADHGIAASGLVNPYPQAVTAQMVLNFLRGGAAINVFCRQHALGLKVVDAGVNFDFGESHSSQKLVREKIGHGTRNYLEGDAMSRDEAIRAIESGKMIVENLYQEGCNCIGLGEMGIGNTSSAALIMSYITGIPVEECAGRGTGVSDEQLSTKKATLRKAFELHQPSIVRSSEAQHSSEAHHSPEAQHSRGTQHSPGAHHSPGADVSLPQAETILQHVGGFEIAMMTGAYLQAAERKMIILVDGFITTAALLLARLIDPAVTDCCIYSHTSGEQGHERMLQYLGAEPLLNLGMRLGEGTGAAMAFPLVKSAVSFLHEMASFESAGVSKK